MTREDGLLWIAVVDVILVRFFSFLRICLGTGLGMSVNRIL
jgi:hypothetical protein